MTIQDFYPVFESGQVLTSDQLNDVVSYLEPQDRMSRSSLIGIGVLCGFDMDFDGRNLTLHKGVAITSEGFLIAEDDVVLSGALKYSLPVSEKGETRKFRRKEVGYEAFLDEKGRQIDLLELTPSDYVAPRGEPNPARLSSSMLANKSVLLFLEKHEDALKNCDVNDCSDKGAEMNVTLRRLLIDRGDADAMLKNGHRLIGPDHPRKGLSTLKLRKINPAGANIRTTGDYFGQTIGTAMQTALETRKALDRAYFAYEHLLGDVFPPEVFKGQPISKHHYLNVMAHWTHNPQLAQHVHGAVEDITLSYNEFLRKAARFDAECCPDAREFPLHVLIGDAQSRPTATQKLPQNLKDWQEFDPKNLTDGPVSTIADTDRRHHFVPSLVLDDGQNRQHELQSLYYRTVLLAQSFFLRDLSIAPIKITPSRSDRTELGKSAVPFYYRFDPAGDLIQNWDLTRTRAHLKATVASYHLSSRHMSKHPLLAHDSSSDFLRVEGLVGKTLSQVIKTLSNQRDMLGLSFSIQPVFLDATRGKNSAGAPVHNYGKSGRQVFESLTKKMAIDEMPELDQNYTSLLAGIQGSLLWLVEELAGLDALEAVKKNPEAPKSEAPKPKEKEPPRRRVSRAKQPKTSYKEMKVQRSKEQVQFMPATTFFVLSTVFPLNVKTMSLKDLYTQSVKHASGGNLRAGFQVAFSKNQKSKNLPTDHFERIYAAISLLAAADQVLNVALAPSIVDFEPKVLSTALNRLSAAFGDYLDVASQDAENLAGEETKEVNNQIADLAQPLMNEGGQVLTVLEKEFLDAVQDKAMTYHLPEFAARHTGLEHLGGVKPGGTLVLLVMPTSEVENAFQAAGKEINEKLSDYIQELSGGQIDHVDMDAGIEQILKTSQSSSKSLFDQCVVLGDFALPYLCRGSMEIWMDGGISGPKPKLNLPPAVDIKEIDTKPEKPVQPKPAPKPKPKPKPAPNKGPIKPTHPEVIKPNPKIREDLIKQPKIKAEVLKNPKVFVADPKVAVKPTVVKTVDIPKAIVTPKVTTKTPTLKTVTPPPKTTVKVAPKKFNMTIDTMLLMGTKKMRLSKASISIQNTKTKKTVRRTSTIKSTVVPLEPGTYRVTVTSKGRPVQARNLRISTKSIKTVFTFR